MMWRTVIIWGWFVGAVFTSPVGVKDIPMVNDDMLNEKTEMAMSTLNLPSNATSIRADITDGFNCDGRLYGYYADIENDCQIFHVCLPVTYPDGKENTFRWSFICPEDTIFSQESFTCVRSLDLGYDCSDSMRFYDLNRNFGVAGDTDSEVHDVLRKTPTDEMSNVQQEPVKPIVPITTAAPLSTRRRPIESNYRRQPTKAAATVAPTPKAKPTRIIPSATTLPTAAAAPVVKTKPMRILPSATITPVTAAPFVKATPTRVIALTTLASDEIKPMFDRNEFMKNDPNNGIRKIPVRPISVKEEANPIEVVPRIELDSENIAPLDEMIKKIPVAHFENAPPLKEETIQPNIVLNTEQDASKPLERLSSDDSKSDGQGPQNGSSLSENPNEPENTPLDDNSVITKFSLDSDNEQSSEQISNENQNGNQKDQLPIMEGNTAEMLKVPDSFSSASTEEKLSEEMVSLPKENLPSEPMQPMQAEVKVSVNANQLNELLMENQDKTGPEMQQSMVNDQAPLLSMVEDVPPEAVTQVSQLEANPDKVEETMPEIGSSPAVQVDDPVVNQVLETSALNENHLVPTKDEQINTDPIRPLSNEPMPMDMSADMNKEIAGNKMNQEGMEQEPIQNDEAMEMPTKEKLDNNDMVIKSEMNQDESTDMQSQSMKPLKTEAEPVMNELSLGSEDTSTMNLAQTPSEPMIPEMELSNAGMPEIKPLMIDPQAQTLDLGAIKKYVLVTPDESAMPNLESEPFKPSQLAETEMKNQDSAPFESGSSLLTEKLNMEEPTDQSQQILKDDADTEKEGTEMVEMPTMNSEEQKSEIIKAISSLVSQAKQDVVSKAQEILPAEATADSDQKFSVDPEMPASGSAAVIDMETLMAAPALLDDRMKSEMPLFIPVRVIMDNEPTKVAAEEPLPEVLRKDAMSSPGPQAAAVMPNSLTVAQSEPIIVDSPAAEEIIVKNAENAVPQEEVAQMMLETDPVAMMDKQEDSAPAALKAEILPVPVEEVQIVEDKPKIEMEIPQPTETKAESKLDAPMLSQDAAVSPTPASLLDEAQPFLQEMIDLASNLVKAETISAPADDFPMVVGPADPAKADKNSASQPVYKSAPTAADGLDGAEIPDPAKPIATFSEPIEEGDKQNELVNDLLRIVTPQRIGELVERTDLPASAASRVDLARSLQRKVDPRKRRFLFKSSVNSR